MKRSLPVDLSLVLSLATVLGMAMAVAGLVTESIGAPMTGTSNS